MSAKTVYYSLNNYAEAFPHITKLPASVLHQSNRIIPVDYLRGELFPT